MDAAHDISARVHAWRDASIIDAGQAERIIAFEREAAVRVGPTLEQAHGARDRMQALFGVLGVLLVGLGVLLTVITNWDSIDDPVKVALLVSTMVVAYAGALSAEARNAPSWVGTVAFVVGMLIFTGGIFVIGTMYNVQVHKPLGMLLVAVFGTGITLLAGRMSVGWIAAVGWLGWGLHELVVSLDDLTDEKMMIQLVTAAIIGAITAVAVGWTLSGIAGRTAAADADDRGARALMKRAELVAFPLRTLATAGLLVLLVQSTFAWHAHDLFKDAVRRPEPYIMLAVAVVASWFMYRNAQLAHRRIIAATLVTYAALALALASWPYGMLVAVVASAMLAVGGVGLVLMGLVESRRELFGWGIAWLAVLVITRYLDFMSAVDLGGPGFIGAGVLLLIIAVLIGRSTRLWRRREQVLR